ncbi:sensor histidine kinase KdpD, partial [Staphylococcus pseudintermedius]|uniref:ATP-binding protein n=1 Tax=Staphylococcus pseudintermedius TaxID=283734 RepID=UPI000E38F351
HGICVVDIDSPLILQAVVNLIENAFKHTPPEAPVTVRVNQNGPHILVERIDRGPGLADEQQQGDIQPLDKEPLFKDNTKDVMRLSLYPVQRVRQSEDRQ